ncbi:hypothetical protein GJ496_005771 [Pomphorhynchus laevis]|nr:hypothetical protein GJ496_005771 [Pomphorhynchus laevis]
MVADKNNENADTPSSNPQPPNSANTSNYLNNAQCSLTNADFRKLLMTSNSGSIDASTVNDKRPKPSEKRKQKKLRYTKTSKEEKSGGKSGLVKYRDRAKERRENVKDEVADIQQQIQQSTTTSYRAVGPDAKATIDAAARRRQIIEESKYLGGDISHTHLVKGLDYALLQKIRKELSGADDNEAPLDSNEIQMNEQVHADDPVTDFKTTFGQNIYQALFGELKPKSKKSERFVSSRMAYIVDLEDSYSDIPTTLLRSKAECQDDERSTLVSTNDFVIEKLTEILWILRSGEREHIRSTKQPKKDFEVDIPKNPLSSIPIYQDDELFEGQFDNTSKPLFSVNNSATTDRYVGNKRDIFNSINSSTQRKEYEIPRFDSSPKLKKKIDIAVSDSYAECYPGTAAEEDVNIDSEDEPDYNKMDLGNKKGPVGRWDFDTQEEYSDYMSRKEAMPKAAFQYGVKMADGRKTRRLHSQLDDKRKLDREWQQITKIIEKRKAVFVENICRYIFKMIESTAVVDDGTWINAKYQYRTSNVCHDESGAIIVSPAQYAMDIRTKKHVPRVGVMMAGIGGNNGSTLVGTVLSNKMKLSWRTKQREQKANYFGSLTQAATTWLGIDNVLKSPVYVPFYSLLPMINPNNIIFDGWDISKMNLADAMIRAQVFEPELQDRLKPIMKEMFPKPAAFDINFVAGNQLHRADNVIEGEKSSQVMQLRADIREFKIKNNLDKVIVVWMGNTERFCKVIPGLNQTAQELLISLQMNASEISPSTLYGIAAVLEGCPFINGSPQNTFVPGLIELAHINKTPIVGDDLKTGQTKIKSVLVDFLVSAGIKPRSIVSYNHLGNNDGLNLSEEVQFRSKEITKSSVIYDSVVNNPILYPDIKPPDHCIVIKYVPEVGDSKRAMDEYINEIGMGGRNTLVIHNTCEDSLLASAVILDLIILAELFSRMEFKMKHDEIYEGMDEILSVLSYLCKAPLVPDGTTIVNALFSQRSCIENVIRAAVGLDPINHMNLEYKLKPFLRKVESKSINGVMNGDREYAANPVQLN